VLGSSPVHLFKYRCRQKPFEMWLSEILAVIEIVVNLFMCFAKGRVSSDNPRGENEPDLNA
jgi:hypothetical protein